MNKIYEFFLLLISLFFISCHKNTLLNENTIHSFNDIANYINDKNINLVKRNLNNPNEIELIDMSNNILQCDETLKQFFHQNSNVESIVKYKPRYVININSNIINKSESVITYENGQKKFLNRLNTAQEDFYLIMINDYKKTLFGNDISSNYYVYSKIIDLTTLTKDELYFLGFYNAKYTGFKNWYYTGPLG